MFTVLILNTDQYFVLHFVAMAFLDAFHRHAQYLQLVIGQRLIQFVAPGHKFILALLRSGIELITYQPAAAFFFGHQTRRFGLLNQVGGIGLITVHFRQPDADVNAEFLIFAIDIKLFNALLDVTHDGFSLFDIGTAQ